MREQLIFLLKLHHLDKKLWNFVSNLKTKQIKVFKEFNMTLNITGVDLVINATSVGFDVWQKNKTGYYNLFYFSPVGILKGLKHIKNKNYGNFFKKNLNIFKKNAFSTLNFFNRNKNCDVFDIIYDPTETPLILIAKQFSKKIYNGLDMNLDQAVLAFSIVHYSKNLKQINKIMVKK